MNIAKRARVIVGAVALIGAVGVGGTALTATGLTNNAGSSQFVGGSVSQSVTGAALTSVTYGYADTTNTAVDTVDLVFDANSAGKTVAVTIHQGGTPTVLTCVSDDDADPGPAAVANKIGLETYGAACTAANLTGVTSIDVAVS